MSENTEALKPPHIFAQIIADVTSKIESESKMNVVGASVKEICDHNARHNDRYEIDVKIRIPFPN